MDDEYIEFGHYERCESSDGWTFFKAWYYNRRTGKWFSRVVDD